MPPQLTSECGRPSHKRPGGTSARGGRALLPQRTTRPVEPRQMQFANCRTPQTLPDSPQLLASESQEPHSPSHEVPGQLGSTSLHTSLLHAGALQNWASPICSHVKRVPYSCHSSKRGTDAVGSCCCALPRQFALGMIQKHACWQAPERSAGMGALFRSN